MTYRVEWSSGAREDIRRLYAFVLDRELSRIDGNLDLAEYGIAAIEQSVLTLRRSPFTCRKASSSPFLRELVIPFGRSGYVALFEIVDDEVVQVVAVRHQLEDDYH